MKERVKLSAEVANAVFDILVDELTADKSYRTTFVTALSLIGGQTYMLDTMIGFSANLKVKDRFWRVEFNSMSQTTGRVEAVQAANKRLAALKNSQFVVVPSDACEVL